MQLRETVVLLFFIFSKYFKLFLAVFMTAHVNFFKCCIIWFISFSLTLFLCNTSVTYSFCFCALALNIKPKHSSEKNYFHLCFFQNLTEYISRFSFFDRFSFFTRISMISSSLMRPGLFLKKNYLKSFKILSIQFPLPGFKETSSS